MTGCADEATQRGRNVLLSDPGPARGLDHCLKLTGTLPELVDDRHESFDRDVEASIARGRFIMLCLRSPIDSKNDSCSVSCTI